MIETLLEGIIYHDNPMVCGASWEVPASLWGMDGLDLECNTEEEREEKARQYLRSVGIKPLDLVFFTREDYSPRQQGELMGQWQTLMIHNLTKKG